MWEGLQPRSQLAERSRRGGDRHHLLLAERLKQRVLQPVDAALRAPRDHAQPVAVEMQLVLAATDLAGLRRVAQRWRVLPGSALDAVVLADQALLDDHAVGRVELALALAAHRDL